MQRRTLSILVAVSLLAAGGLAVVAQETGAAEETGQPTLTGCLNGVDGQWMITGEDGAYPVVEGAANLEPHNGHRVRLTGRWQEDADGEKAFVAEAVEHLGVCEED